MEVGYSQICLWWWHMPQIDSKNELYVKRIKEAVSEWFKKHRKYNISYKVGPKQIDIENIMC